MDTHNQIQTDSETIFGMHREINCLLTKQKKTVKGNILVLLELSSLIAISMYQRLGASDNHRFKVSEYRYNLGLLTL